MVQETIFFKSLKKATKHNFMRFFAIYNIYGQIFSKHKTRSVKLYVK